MIMDETTKARLMAAISLDNENLMEDKLTEAVTGTVYEKMAQSSKSIFYTIIKLLFKTPWLAFLNAVGLLLPQLFVRYATDDWLDQHAYDHGLERDQGKKARFMLTLAKDTNDQFTVFQGDVFYIDELTPRRYLAVSETEFPTGTTDCLVEVEAENVGSKYNVLADTITQTSVSYPIFSLSHSGIPTVYGVDIEDNETLRERIFAVKTGQLTLGTDPYYVSVLKTVPQVVAATLDNVDDQAVMSYTIYGQTGLGQDVVDEAQSLIDLKKMETDTIIVSAATSQDLLLTVDILGTFSTTEVLGEISQFFVDLERGAIFESSLLTLQLYKKFGFEQIRITPQYQAVDPGKFFVPVPTIRSF